MGGLRAPFRIFSAFLPSLLGYRPRGIASAARLSACRAQLSMALTLMQRMQLFMQMRAFPPHCATVKSFEIEFTSHRNPSTPISGQESTM